MRTLILSAAEASGDLLAAELWQAVRARDPGLRAVGIAGPAMRAAGIEPLYRTEDLGVMGLTEVLGHLGRVRAARAAVRAALDRGAWALVVVDAPDLHLPLARRARALDIPAIGYVSPQIWAWRPTRARGIARDLDALLCLFSFEPPLYADAAARYGCDVRWVGHPVVDRLPPRGTLDPEYSRDPERSRDPDLYGLLPGSRAQELARHLPIFVSVAERVRSQQPTARFRACLPVGARADLPDFIERCADIRELRGARAALTKSGTVTLELACMDVPMVVAHQVSGLTYQVGRRAVTGVRHIALPNILADRAGQPAPVPEFVQRLDPAVLAAALVDLPPAQAHVLDALGAPGAADRAAAALLEPR